MKKIFLLFAIFIFINSGVLFASDQNNDYSINAVGALNVGIPYYNNLSYTFVCTKQGSQRDSIYICTDQNKKDMVLNVTCKGNNSKSVCSVTIITPEKSNVRNLHGIGKDVNISVDEEFLTDKYKVDVDSTIGADDHCIIRINIYLSETEKNILKPLGNAIKLSIQSGLSDKFEEVNFEAVGVSLSIKDNINNIIVGVVAPGSVCSDSDSVEVIHRAINDNLKKYIK